MKTSTPFKLCRILIKCLFGLGLYFSLHLFCERQTDGFALGKTSLREIDFLNYSNSPIDREEIDSLTSGHYTYLGMGSECFTFLSEDKKTVLKLFKLTPWRFVYFKKALFANMPTALFEKVRHLHKERLSSTFASCSIAWADLREETGLVYVHLQPSSDIKKKIIIYDKIGIKHTIDLDNTAFILQKKAELALTALEDYYKEDESLARNCIDSLLDLIVLRSKKGIADRDPMIERNFGFLGTKAIEIDIGSFSYNEHIKDPILYKQSLRTELEPLKEWLCLHAPKLAGYLEDKLSHVEEIPHA